MFENTFMDFFIKNQLQMDTCVTFVKSLSSVPSTSFLRTRTWQKSLQQDIWLTLLLYSRGSLNGNLYSFSATQGCYSQGTSTKRLFLLEQAVQSAYKNFFRNIQKKIYRKTNVVASNLSNISGRKCLWCNSSYFQ